MKSIVVTLTEEEIEIIDAAVYAYSDTEPVDEVAAFNLVKRLHLALASTDPKES